MNSVLMNLYNRSKRDAVYGWDNEEITIYPAPTCVTSIGEAFYKSNADCFQWELVILDWHSTDCDPVLWADEYMQGKLPIRIVKQSGQFDRAAGKNALARLAKDSDILFFIDADMMIEPGLITRAIEVLNDADFYFPRCRYYLNPARTLLSDYIVTAHGNFFCRGEAFRKTSGFHEGQAWGKEDNLFRDSLRLLPDVFKVVTENSPHIYHQWHPHEWRV